MAARDDGFTLIEVIVALAIFASLIAGLNAAMTGGWRGVRNADREAAALVLAKSRLAAAGIEVPFEETSRSGTVDGIAWSVVMTPYFAPDGDNGERPNRGPKPYWVDVKVRWSDGPFRADQSLTLSTVKLATRQP